MASLASVKAPAAFSSRSLPAARCLGAALRPSCPRKAVRVQARASTNDAAFEVGKALSLTAVASSWMMAGNAQAAQELTQMAASDNRFGTIALLFIPALGWVAFNIFQPLLNQLGRMNELAEDSKGGRSSGGRKKRSVAGAVGLGAALALAAAQQADAVTELSQLAASDNRFGTITLLFVPALGWVAYNIFQPLLNQLGRMDELAEGAKGSVARAARRR